jgi:hypothetical protein
MYNIKPSHLIFFWSRHFEFLFTQIYKRSPPPWRNSPNWARTSRLHSDTHHTRWDSSGRVISPSQRPLPDNTTLKRHRLPCPWWDSNPQSEQVSDRRPTGVGCAIMKRLEIWSICWVRFQNTACFDKTVKKSLQCVGVSLENSLSQTLLLTQNSPCLIVMSRN